MRPTGGDRKQLPSLAGSYQPGRPCYVNNGTQSLPNIHRDTPGRDGKNSARTLVMENSVIKSAARSPIGPKEKPEVDMISKLKDAGIIPKDRNSKGQIHRDLAKESVRNTPSPKRPSGVSRSQSLSVRPLSNRHTDPSTLRKEHAQLENRMQHFYQNLETEKEADKRKKSQQQPVVNVVLQLESKQHRKKSDTSSMKLSPKQDENLTAAVNVETHNEIPDDHRPDSKQSPGETGIHGNHSVTSNRGQLSWKSVMPQSVTHHEASLRNSQTTLEMQMYNQTKGQFSTSLQKSKTGSKTVETNPEQKTREAGSNDRGIPRFTARRSMRRTPTFKLHQMLDEMMKQRTTQEKIQMEELKKGMAMEVGSGRGNAEVIGSNGVNISLSVTAVGVCKDGQE